MSPTGVATIYNVTGWANPLSCFNDVNTFYILPFILILFKILFLFRYNIQLMDLEMQTL